MLAVLLTGFRTVRALSIVTALAFAALGSGCGTLGGAGSGASTAQALGRRVPDLSLRTLSGGKPMRLSSYRGKVVLLDIWASWCQPCRAELPALDEIAERLASRGVEVIAVSVDESHADAEAFVRGRRRWTLTLAHDPNGAIGDRLQPAVMPTSYLIDRDGILRYVNAGFQPGDARTIEARLLELSGRR